MEHAIRDHSMTCGNTNHVGLCICQHALIVHVLRHKSVFGIWDNELPIFDLLIVGEFSKLLDIESSFNISKINVIGYPHIFQCLQEETLLQLLLSKDFNKVLLFKVEGKKP